MDKEKKTKQEKLVFLLLGAGVLLALLLPFCWWYGYYPEWGKSIDKLEESQTYLLLYQQYNEDPVTTPNEMIYDALREEFSETNTEVLVDIFLFMTEGWIDAYKPYREFQSIFRSGSLQELDEKKDYHSLITYALYSRHSAGRILMKAYQEVPLTYSFHYQGKKYTKGDPGKVSFLEMILTQEEIQKHLTFWEKKALPKLADQKQIQKFLEPIYPLDAAKYNYLYTDTCGYRNQDIYGKDYKEDFGWLDEKVEERAKPFTHLRDDILTAKDTAGWENLSLKERAQHIKDSQRRRYVLDLLEKMWPAATKAENWERFDNCQISQP